MSPLIRVNGDICRINVAKMDHKEVHSLIYEIMNDKQRKDYEEFLETDFSFEVPNLVCFRVNAFTQNRGSAVVFSTIPFRIMTTEQLGMG
jgi:twitching motility protein PilT